MSKKLSSAEQCDPKQSQLNYDDPVEYLAPPFYLSAAPHLRNPVSPNPPNSFKVTVIEIAPEEMRIIITIRSGGA